MRVDVRPGLAIFGKSSGMSGKTRRYRRDRSLITIVNLAALYRVNELPFHLGKGLENGLLRDEIVAAITHTAFYAGWPTAMTALQIARKVFTDAGDCGRCPAVCAKPACNVGKGRRPSPGSIVILSHSSRQDAHTR